MDAVLLTAGCSDPLYRRSARVSMGTVFQVPWTYVSTDWLAQLNALGFKSAAMALTDAVARYVPGVLGSDESTGEESFTDGLLEYPQYTRPRVYEGMEVPEVLLNGDHAKIRQWRREQSLLTTLRMRPDLFQTAEMTDKERQAALAAAKQEAEECC